MVHMDNPRRKDYVWNTAAGLINAAEAVVMSMIVTRMTGLSDAGMLTMAFAVGNLMLPIGKFGVRNFQVTDVEHKFSLFTYIMTRLATVIVMVISVCGYLGYAASRLGYSSDKIGVVFAVCMIYAVEALEDVIWGYYQQRNRLYAGAGMFCVRWTGILLFFPVALYISRSLKDTLLWCMILSAVIFLILLRVSYPRICRREDRFSEMSGNRIDFRQIGRLLKAVLPLFGISFLALYENNMPKYSIDAYMTDEIQACYGFVAMPVFVIGLLNNFIYQPSLVPMAVEWEQGQVVKFRKRIGRQIMIIGALAGVCMTGAYLLGIPVLSLLYNTDLTGYKRELMILLLASAFLAASGYQSVVLTIMRCQKALLLPHCITAVLATVSLPRAVAGFGTMGAASCYMVLMALLCFMYGAVLIIKLKGNKI
ncbi:MAG: lipopolysaccharide biosynthesis protein [Lachnospiraceae bacterium]|nr:lipopolysaccharide biosynthesis protein [Lachnospiraceae bacterium]